MVVSDVWLRHVGKEGDAYVQHHRARDPKRFVAEQQDAAKKVGGKARVEQITEAQFRAERRA